MNNSYPYVSIILLNLNGEKFANLWSSIFELSYPVSKYEIIFVDNGSKDKSVKLFTKLVSKKPRVNVKIVSNKRNLGYSEGYNIGLNYANGEYVVLLSNDILVERDWLKNMIEILEENKDIAVAQSSMFLLLNRNQVDIGAHFIDKLGYCFRAPPFENIPDIYYYKPFTKITDVFFAEGAVMFIRKSVIKETGGLFDDEYFMFYEDIDFCWRVKLRGYRVCVVPHSKVYHARGGTVRGTIIKLQPTFVFTNTRNRLRTLFKNYDSLNLWRYLPLAILYELLKSIFLFANRKRIESVEAVRGVFAFLFEIPKLLSKRKKIQKIRRVKDSEIFKCMHSIKHSTINLVISSKKLLKEWR